MCGTIESMNNKGRALAKHARNKKLEKEFAGYLIDGATYEEAYRAIKPQSKAANHTVDRVASQWVRAHPEMFNALAQLMEAQGMGIPVVTGELKRMLTADKEILDKHGDKVTVIDNPSRLSAINTALRLYKLIDNNTLQHIDARSVTMNISTADTTKLDAVIDGLNKLNHTLGTDTGAQTGEISDAEIVEGDGEK